MTIDDKIRDEKFQYNINKEALKISASSSEKKKDKQEFLLGKEILPFDQSRIIEQAKFTYSFQEKLLKNKQKQLKTKTS